MREILADTTGEFKNQTSLGKKVTNGEALGAIASLGEEFDQCATCDGTIDFIRSNGDVLTNEVLYKIDDGVKEEEERPPLVA